MAELIYSVAGVAVLVVGTSATNQISNLLFSKSTDRKYAQQRFGKLGMLIVGTIFDVRQLRRMEDQILQGSDEDIMNFKSSHLSSIGQTSVASAIFAQLGMTTLQLPGLDSVHWTGSAFLIASLVFGVISVVIVCLQQQTLGMLNNARQVRFWLSTGHYSSQAHEDEEGNETASPVIDRSKTRLQASIAALVVLRIPNAFLCYSVLCYLTGLGLYLGFAYRQDLQNTPGRDNNEAVMIFYLIIAAFAIMESAGATAWKLSESNYTSAKWEDDEHRSSDNWKNQGSRSKRGNQDQDTDTNERSPLLSGGSGSSSRDGEIRQAIQAMARAHEEAAKTERRLMDLLKHD